MTHLLKSFPFLPVEVVRGQGSYVYDASGERYLDMYAGHAVCSTGHCHPHVVAALQEQIGKLMFYSNAIRMPIREQAADRLMAHAPPGFGQVFFSNSGAEANENALKLARRFTGRSKIIAMEKSWHGRTVGALSVTDAPKVRAQGGPLLPDVAFVPFGEVPEIDPRTAAVILEPVQSMAGVRTASADYFVELRRRCDAAGAVLIFDEVQTGMGRCGTMLFSGTHGVAPDIITLAKGIASGIPLSATVVCDRLAESVDYGEYGTTFGAGPVAMAGMIATLDVLECEGVLQSVRDTGVWLREQLLELPGVVETRGMGLLVGVKTEFETKAVQNALLERRVLCGGSGEPGVLRLLPPLTLSRNEAEQCLGAMKDALSAAADPGSAPPALAPKETT